MAPMGKMWMVRAEAGGRLYDDFKDKKAVAIGWKEIGTLQNLDTRDQISRKLSESWPGAKWIPMAAGQLFRFRNEMEVGDKVVTYSPSTRRYLVGTISSGYEFRSDIFPDDPNLRWVNWYKEISRDALSVASKNGLGSISTLFLLSDDVARDVELALAGTLSYEQPPDTTLVEEDVIVDDVQSRAFEFIKDKVSRLDWSEMQDLIAGILRSMGYKTLTSPDGPDQGKDIVASRDGFGFEVPRIIVEVKHRSSASTSQQIRSFLGGRHKDDKGLYVSTSGFTKDAKYEAARASIPLHLMDIGDVVRILIENYDNLDNETKKLIPLKKIYWPL